MRCNSKTVGLFDKIFKNDDKVEQLFKNIITYEDPKKFFSIHLPAIYNPDKPLVNRSKNFLSPTDEQISFSCYGSEEIFPFSCGEGTFEIYIFKNFNSFNLDEFFQHQKERGYLKIPFFLAEQKRSPEIKVEKISLAKTDHEIIKTMRLKVIKEPIVERISHANNPAIKVSYAMESADIGNQTIIRYNNVIYFTKNEEYLFRLIFSSKEGRYQSRYIDNIPKIWESFKILI